MSRFNFWTTGLLIVAWVMVVLGLFIAFFNATGIFAFLFNDQIDPVFWGGTTPSDQSLTFQRWAYGLLGSTLAGWGVMLVFLVRNAFPQREKWAWKAVFWGSLVWFLADSAISIQFGVTFNVIFNVGLYLSILVPLLVIRKDFTNRNLQGTNIT